jgi:transposase-like protein
MKPKKFPEKFKIEAVRQIVKRDYPVLEVSARLGVSPTVCTSGSRAYS